MSDLEESEYQTIMETAITPDVLKKAQTFHFKGGLNFKKLSFLHKGALIMIKKLKFDKVPVDEQLPDFKHMMARYYDSYDFSNKTMILPLVEAVKSLEKEASR